MEKKLRGLIKNAMISKDKQKQVTYKNILEKAQKTAKDSKVNVSDSIIFDAIKKEIKQLYDLLRYCQEGTDKYNETVQNIELCKSLLPSMADKDTMLKYLIDNNIDKNIGSCMKALKSNYKDSFDGKEANLATKEYIN